MSPVRVALAFALGVTGIATAPLFMRFALPAPPVVSAFYRLFFASLLLAGGLLLARRVPALPRRSLWLAAGAGVCFGGDMALWHTALAHTSVANATLLVNTTPIHVGLVSAIVYGERFDRRFVTGAALALLGAALLLGVDAGAGLALRGDALALAGAIFYAGYLLLTKSARTRADAIPTLFVSMLASTLTLAVSGWALGDRFAGFPASSWAAMLGAAVVPQLIGVVALVWAFRYLRATFTSIALLAQPLLATLFGWLILAEALTGLQALGGGGVLLGIFLASRQASDHEASL